MQTILVPTDYSKPSVNAAHYALMLAKHISVRILLLHAFQIPVVSSEATIVTIPFEDLEKLHATKLKKLVATLRKKHGHGIEIIPLAQAGFAVDIIKEVMRATT